MLDEHLLEGVVGEAGVDRGAAQRGEVREGGLKFFVGRDEGRDAARPLDQLADVLAQLGHTLAEFPAGALPVGDRRLGVGEEFFEDFDELLDSSVEIEGNNDFAILDEQGALRLPEECVLGRVAGLELGAELGAEVVGVVLGLDDAVDKAVVVHEHGVEPERGLVLARPRVLADECPAERRGDALDEPVKGGAHGGPVPGADVGQLGEREPVGADGGAFGGGDDGGGGHQRLGDVHGPRRGGQARAKKCGGVASGAPASGPA